MNDIMLEKQLTIQENHDGWRIDRALAQMIPDYSRNFLAQLIESHQVLLDGEKVERRKKVKQGQIITIKEIAKHEKKQEENWYKANNITLDIVHEDEDIIILNKQSNLTVHPGAGCYDNTLVNGLINHDPKLAEIPRAGLVHRLDRDTTGLLLVARNIKAQFFLSQELQQRKINRIYEAIVHKPLISGGKIEAPIGRDHKIRTKMAVRNEGRSALTHYKIKQNFQNYSHIELKLETGRTHQIRVHLKYIGHPVIGDQTYGKNIVIKNHFSENLKESLKQLDRQALHATKLQLTHPSTREVYDFSCPLPEDLAKIIFYLNLEDKKI